jgi:hypothetical protein
LEAGAVMDEPTLEELEELEDEFLALEIEEDLALEEEEDSLFDDALFVSLSALEEEESAGDGEYLRSIGAGWDDVE